MIGEHSVLLIPDPDVQAWGPQLASNHGMDVDLTGWGSQPFGGVWTWTAPGEALGDDKSGVSSKSWLLVRTTAAPIPRDASSLYRVRTRVWVAAATPVIVALRYGRTPAAANGGAFYFPNDATSQQVWVNAPTAGYFTFEATFNPETIDPAFVYLAPVVNVYPATRPFPGRPRVDSLELQGQGSESVDITCLIDEATIHHGREDADSQPDAASCTLELTSFTGTALVIPDSLEVGGIIRVVTDVGAETSSTRFVGRITDISLGWDDAGEDTPDRPAGQIIAVAMLSDLGRRVVGDAPWAQELDGARVARIMSAAGVSLDPTYSDPGTVQILARDVDAQPALDLAQSVAQDARGLVWHTRTGEVRYADAEHRRGATPGLELDACDILVSPTWKRSTEGLINLVSIGYGPTPAEGEQPRYVASRADSQARYGRYEQSSTTQLALLADAQAMASLLLTRNSTPVWVMLELPIDVKNLDLARTIQLLSLDVHGLVDLTGLPIAGAAPTSALLWVEGWDERLGWGEHELTLTVSGYCRTSPAPRWDDTAPDQTWDTIAPAALTWDEAACLPPTPTRGRWADVPASTRWNTVGAGVTWDTWK